MFKYKNLPENCDEAFIERTLFWRGRILWFKDDVLGLLSLPVSDGGKIDIYGVGTLREVYADNGYHVNRNPSNSVVMFNNYLRMPSCMDIEFYAESLYDIHQSIRSNLYLSRVAGIVLCDEEEQLTYQNLIKNWDGMQPITFGRKNLDLDALKVLEFKCPFDADKRLNVKDRIWGEALQRLGVPNITIPKKERMVSAEVESMGGATTASLFTRLAMREQAIEQVNRMFGTNIEIVYRNDEYQQKYQDFKNVSRETSDEEGGRQ